MKEVKRKIAKIIGEKALQKANHVVGKSFQWGVYEIEVPEELRKKVKDESNQ